MLKEFAQGAAQSAVQPVADFLAPTVEVPTSIGRYKIYTEKNRFAPPDTSRAIGGRATMLSFDATDATYNCQPNALDFPIDYLEQIEEAALTNALMEGATIVAEVAALCHEQNVINAAVAATSGSALAKTWSGTSGSDPVDDIDAQILNVIKAARYGSLMGVGVLFGAGAWRIFKNATNVRSRFVAAGDDAIPNVTLGRRDEAFRGESRGADVLHGGRHDEGGPGAEHQLPAGCVGAGFRAAAEPDPARSVVHEDIPADGQLHGAGFVPARRRPRGGGEVRLERGDRDHE